MLVNALTFIQIVMRHISELYLGLQMYTCDRNTAMRLLDGLIKTFLLLKKSAAQPVMRLAVVLFDKMSNT